MSLRLPLKRCFPRRRSLETNYWSNQTNCGLYPCRLQASVLHSRSPHNCHGGSHAIVIARPLTPIPSDPDMPEVLTPTAPLRHKISKFESSSRKLHQCRPAYNKQWRQVQHLANAFWSRWSKEYLLTLQPRRKWQQKTQNLEEGDVVFFRCKELPRNNWPLARITKTYTSADDKERKVEVEDGVKRSSARPVDRSHTTQK